MWGGGSKIINQLWYQYDAEDNEFYAMRDYYESSSSIKTNYNIVEDGEVTYSGAFTMLPRIAGVTAIIDNVSSGGSENYMKLKVDISNIIPSSDATYKYVARPFTPVNITFGILASDVENMGIADHTFKISVVDTNMKDTFGSDFTVCKAQLEGDDGKWVLQNGYYRHSLPTFYTQYEHTLKLTGEEINHSLGSLTEVIFMADANPTVDTNINTQTLHPSEPGYLIFDIREMELYTEYLGNNITWQDVIDNMWGGDLYGGQSWLTVTTSDGDVNLDITSVSDDYLFLKFDLSNLDGTPLQNAYIESIVFNDATSGYCPESRYEDTLGGTNLGMILSETGMYGTIDIACTFNLNWPTDITGQMHKYTCQVCGYVAEQASMPTTPCPQCKQTNWKQTS